MLARCYIRLRLEEEAEALLREVAFKREIVLGANSKYTLGSKAELAEFLFMKKKVEEALIINTELIRLR